MKSIKFFIDVSFTGLCQIEMLNEGNIATLLKNVHQANDSQTTTSSNLPAKWFPIIWGHINKYGNLDDFIGLPLIPLDTENVAVLKPKSLIIFHEDTEMNDVISLLMHLGFIVTRKLPRYICQNSSVFQCKYIHKYKDENLFDLLSILTSFIKQDEIVLKFCAFNNNRAKLALFHKLSISSFVTKNLDDLLRSLPFIETIESNELVCINQCNQIAPRELPSVMTGTKLLKFKNDAQSSFIQRFGGRQLSKQELIEHILLPAIENSVSGGSHVADDSMIEYILNAIPTDPDGRRQWQRVIKRLSNVEFVRSDDGKLHRPKELFHRRERLVELFKEETGRFAEHGQNVEMLELKGEHDVSANDVIYCLDTLSIMKDPQQAKSKSKCILEHLECYGNLLNNHALVNKVQDTAWIPVQKERPDTYPECLTWFGEGCDIARPVEMVLYESSSLVGSVRAVFHKNFENFKAIKIAKQTSKVHPKDVIDQLFYVIREYDVRYKNECLIVLKKVYSYLQEMFEELTPDQKEHLKREAWVWCENGFVKPHQVVLEVCTLDLRPYVYNLPQDIQESQRLLLKCGSIASVEKETLIDVLYEVKQAHELETHSGVRVDRDRKLCVEILTILCQMELSEDELERVLVPVRCEDGEFLLKNSNKTVYCSIGALDLEEEEDEEEAGEVFYLHECVTDQLAIGLQIRSLASKQIGAEDMGIFEEYGQHEPLTRRINRILADYGDGFAIVKELIQNADDAGATEVKLLYDERLNEDKRKYLIDPGMCDFQGPALWAYNNAKFSKEDFDNIVKLSGATKEEKRDKIGKFGLGFNAVYNVTDVPSFISDNQLVILDPHTTNLGSAIKNKSKPGIKIPLGPSRNRLRRFADQLRIYDGVFGMDASLQNDYKMFDGTLFRFPLRTEEQAKRSEIKDLFYNEKEMKKLLEKFALEANRLLMFTQKVHSVEIFHLQKDAKHGKDMIRILHVSKSIFHPDLESGRLTVRSCPSFDIMYHSSSFVTSYKANDPEIQSLTKDIQNIINIATIIDDAAEDKFSIKSKCSKETWFIHSSVDEDECMKMALKDARLNPVASVAVYIDENTNGEQSKKGRLELISSKGYFYCFLPLPISNGFTVHINSTFALSKDRKSFLVISEDDKTLDTQETIWNRTLMSGPVSLAYVGLLKDLTVIIDVKNEDVWYEHWPRRRAVQSRECNYNQELIRSFYLTVITDKVCIFPSLQKKTEWLNWSQIRAIDHSIKSQRNGERIVNMMEEVFGLFVKNKTIVHVPQEILSMIEENSCKEVLSMIVISFSEFFTDIFMPNVKHNQIRMDIRNEILVFAILEYTSDPSVVHSLKVHECIPTKPYSCLRQPSDLVKPGSKAAGLFIVHEEVFPLNEFSDCYEKLLDFGMTSDNISWELLIHRAETVNDLSKSNLKVAQERSKKILELIKEKDLNGNGPPICSWENVVFLPVKSRPLDWQCLCWEGERSDIKFAAAKEIYSSLLENIVGCHKLIVDDSITRRLNSNVEKLLGINTKITLQDIIRQVDMISECIKDRTDSEMSRILLAVFQSIYQTLSGFIKSNSEVKTEIEDGLRDKAIILTEDMTLVKSYQVAFSHKYDSRPYLYKLQTEYAEKYYEVMTILDVRERFHMKDYHHALLAIKDEANGSPLNDSQLVTVRNLLESINNESAPSPEDVVLPAKDKILWPKKTIVVKEHILMKSDSRKRYLHDSIPPRLALSLGAKTERSHSISLQSRGLPFGQNEKLTVRLKRILEAYPSQIQILYELLQNADDAGARQVKFVLDKRHHADKRVFGDAWKPLQGPALLVFNDAPFTQQDIEGIQNLGEGSKSDDSQKTGQYGIGFNVVYHVTDAPCLLTKVEDKSVLCIFDPHARYLEECSEAEPGRMFEDGREYLKETFPDIYNTFLPDLLTNEESAILRLPLRTQSQANSSFIKDRATTTEEIMKMFDGFKDKGPEAIVFLRHVRSVELYVIDYNMPPKRMFSVKANMANTGAMSLYNEEYKLLSGVIEKRSESKRNFKRHLCELCLSIDGKEGNKWTVIQKCASFHPEDLPLSLNEQYERGKLPLIPAGGIACNIDREGIPGKIYCLLPLAVSSSLPIHVNGKFILDYESRRRLWYTNEDSFQKEWNYYVIEHCIIPCYVEFICILADEKKFKFGKLNPFEVLNDAFENAGSHPKEVDAYFNYFPKLTNNEKPHEYEAELIKMFYKRLTTEAVNIMPVLRPLNKALKVEFYPPNSEANQFYVAEFYLEQDKSIQQNSSLICIALTRIGMNIYNIPATIVQSFDESGVPLERLTPQVVREFLIASSHKILHDRDELDLAVSVYRDVETVEALLRYCMKDEKFQLNGMPLLVTEDGMLRRFDESKHVYFDEISFLFPSKLSFALHHDLRGVLCKWKEYKSGPLRKFMLADFTQELDEELLPKFKTNREIEIADVNALNAEFPTKHWLHKAWEFLRRHFEKYKKEKLEEEKQRVQKARQTMRVQERSLEQMGVTAQNFLHQVSGWCLYPVERHIKDGKAARKRYFLIRIDTSSTVVTGGGEIYHIVTELGLPVPSSLFVEDSNRSAFTPSMSLLNPYTGNNYTMPNYIFLTELATSTGNVNAFIDALTNEKQREQSGFSNLSTSSAKDLLRFFNRRTNTIDWLRIQSLKDLPMWEDLSGKLKSISNAKRVYLIGDAMPKDGTNCLQDKYNVILLTRHLDLIQIYEKIGLETQDDSNVYKNFILEHFDELQPTDRLAHLSYLRDKYITSCKLDPDLETKLVNTRIIEKDGVLSFARDFYDPEIRLFIVMLRELEFPPKPYSEWNWLKFLRFLGLISQVSSDLFCEFAGRISEIPKEERSVKSQALIEHLRASDVLKQDRSFLGELSFIDFLVPDKLDEKLVKVHPGRNEESLFCFNGSLMHSDKNKTLCWTIENILPYYASKLMYLGSLPFQDLCVKADVPIYSVARNLENVSKSDMLSSVGTGVKTYSTTYNISEIFVTAYEFLQNQKQIDDNSLKLLSKIPMVTVNDNLISIARKVTIERVFNMPPYLFSMPISLGKYAELFKKIGMTETPSIYQLVKVLNDLFVNSNGNPLDPNEAQNTLIVVGRMTDITDKEEFPHDIASLHLPGVQGNKEKSVSLYDSRELVYFDDAHLESRLNNLGKPRLYLGFVKSNMKPSTQIAASKLICKLPLVLRPEMLSSVIREEMMESATIPNFGLTQDLQNVMSSIEFAECMIRLMKHQRDGYSEDSKRNIREVAELFSRIHVITKERVKTVLVFQSNGMRLEESECDKDVFVTTQDKALQVHVSSSLTEKLSYIIAGVASALVSFFKGYFNDAELSPHVTALLQTDPTEMHQYLDKQNIRRDFEGVESLYGILYSPGGFVPIDLHCLLVNDISKFNVGDFIAYEVEDPGVDDKDGDPVYIYAKILECITEGEYQDFYKIDIGLEEPKIVHKSELYGFYRPDNLEEDHDEEPETLEEVKEKIRKELEQAFKHGEQYAKKVIKRLWLKWHPDKNLGNEEFCTEIFKFIQEQASHLRGDSNDHFWSSEKSYRRYEQRGREFYQRKTNFCRSSKRGFSWRNGHWKASNDTKNPQPGEARRWYRQAKCDLVAARGNPVEGCYEWVCFKCHQVSSQYFLSNIAMCSFVIC